AALPAEAETAAVLAVAAAERIERVLPPEDSPAGVLLTRVRCLREWMTELRLPAFDENALAELLPWLCRGRRSLPELREGPWLEAIQSKLTPQQYQAVEREAPERIQVP